MSNSDSNKILLAGHAVRVKVTDKNITASITVYGESDQANAVFRVCQYLSEQGVKVDELTVERVDGSTVPRFRNEGLNRLPNIQWPEA